MTSLRQKVLKYTAVLVPVTTILMTKTAMAQDEINRGLSRSRIDRLFPNLRFTGVSDFLFFIVQVLLFVAGGIAVLFVIIGGFQYITSAGNTEGATRGKKTVINSIIGIVIIILSYLIISVIVDTLLGGAFFTN